MGLSRSVCQDCRVVDLGDGTRRQELRIALVMNGGVSLAVWMGGVTLELDRVRRSDGAYAELLSLTESEARIDVIAGASAGGINGAVLALAIARECTVDDVRGLWMERGDIAALLRDPHERDSPSVLQGDGQLLKELSGAFATIGKTNGGPTALRSPRAPLYLSITGTIPDGRQTLYPDAFGSMIADVTHRALFRFRRPGLSSGGSRAGGIPQPECEQWPDDFALEPGNGTSDLAAARLALAARSSASFPLAFEPSRVPIGSCVDALHPDMKDIADFDSERWVIDGGVLVNTPVEEALEAIKALPAERSVRRVLGYVVPDPASPSPQVAHGMPSPLQVAVDALSRLPRVQSVGRELEQIRQNNERVRRRREARERALGALDPDSLDVALRFFPAYLSARRSAAADEVVRLLVDATGARAVPTAEQLAELEDGLRALEVAPWLPPQGDYQSFTEIPIEPWRWGLAPIENAANVALQALQRLGHLGGTAHSEEIEVLRARLHTLLERLRQIEAEHIEHWQDAARQLFPQDGPVADLGSDTTEGLVRAWEESFSGTLEQLARTIAAIVLDLSRVLEREETVEMLADEDTGLFRMLRSLDGDSPEEALRRLLTLDVVQRALGAELGGIEQAVELVLMSANANTFGDETRAQEKLAGLQVHHFGAFYKYSWRANDWMWGRLDGADRLVRTLLDPNRIQRRLQLRKGEEGHLTVAAVLKEIHGIACPQGTPATRWLERQWTDQKCEATIHDELKELLKPRTPRDQSEPLPVALDAAYTAICRRVQIEIVLKEVSKIAEAVQIDGKAGVSPRSPGARWERRHFADGQPPTVEEVLLAFEGCPVGRELIEHEIRSRRYIEVSTKGAAVIGSLLAGVLGRVSVLKPVSVAIRAPLLTIYHGTKVATKLNNRVAQVVKKLNELNRRR
jgi:patatin-related protein